MDRITGGGYYAFHNALIVISRRAVAPRYKNSFQFVLFMTGQEHQHGTWIQRIWRQIRDLYHQLEPCRFSFLVALIACPVFLCVAQGTEILRTVGEGMAISSYWYWLRLILFFAPLMLWTISSWYAARFFFTSSFQGVPVLLLRRGPKLLCRAFLGSLQ